jgi:hypothetical protein
MATLLQDTGSLVESSQDWTRKTQGDNRVSLELVSRRYEAEGKPNLWLIGVAHIADASFYDEVTLLLDEMDIVLYESVRPTGSRPPSGVTDEERIESTSKSLEFVADIAKRSAEETGIFPLEIEDVIVSAASFDRRLSSWVEDASIDAWGRPFSLQVDQENNTITCWSFGSDFKVGGVGSAQDLSSKRTIVISKNPTHAVQDDKDKGIQADMADVLGLEFQLDALSYEDPNWFCSDLTIGEVEAKLIERGADPAILGAITGESFTAKIASGMMKLIPMLDMLTGGGIRETARLLMIELLTMPNSDQMLEGIEPELAHVIIVDRNTEVLNDIAATIEIVENVSTIGILYGAGHMNDMAERLHTLFGYVPVEDRWFISMSVNPNDSLLDESDLKRMRFMLQYHMYKAKEVESKKLNPNKIN